MVSEFRIEIDRPLSEVYAAFNNPDNLPRWITGLQRTEAISGTPGQVGAKTRQIYLERGRIVELIETITAHEPMKRFAGEIAGQGVNCAIHVEFVDRGGSTLVVAFPRFRGHYLKGGYDVPNAEINWRETATSGVLAGVQGGCSSPGLG